MPAWHSLRCTVCSCLTACEGQAQCHACRQFWCLSQHHSEVGRGCTSSKTGYGPQLGATVANQLQLLVRACHSVSSSCECSPTVTAIFAAVEAVFKHIAIRKSPKSIDASQHEARCSAIACKSHNQVLNLPLAGASSWVKYMTPLVYSWAACCAARKLQDKTFNVLSGFKWHLPAPRRHHWWSLKL
jgi:hypothetical protein